MAPWFTVYILLKANLLGVQVLSNTEEGIAWT